MEKVCKKCAPKTSPRPHLILITYPKHPMHTRNSGKKDILKKDQQKTLKKIT